MPLASFTRSTTRIYNFCAEPETKSRPISRVYEIRTNSPESTALERVAPGRAKMVVRYALGGQQLCEGNPRQTWGFPHTKGGWRELCEGFSGGGKETGIQHSLDGLRSTSVLKRPGEQT